MFDKLKGRQEYSRQELISQLDELLNYVEDGYRQRQSAHEVEEGIFRKVLELGRMAFGLFFRLCGDADQGERMVLANGKEVRRLKDLHKREYFSVFGLFELVRTVYGTREKHKIQWVPLDARNFSFLPGSQDRV